MARREYQNPPLREGSGPTGKFYYLRWRDKVRGAGGEVIRQARYKSWLAKEGKNATHPQALTKREAERERQRILDKVNNQSYSVQSQIPWLEFCDLFERNHVSQLSAASQASYEAIVGKYLRPAFAKLQLGQIAPEDCEIFLCEQDVAPKTRHNIKAVLSSLFKLAIRWRYIDRSPIDGVHIPKPERVREKVLLTPAQVLLLLATCPMDLRLMIQTLALTGMRISECLALRWKSIDWELGVVHVVQSQWRGHFRDCKTEKSRRPLPLGEGLAKVLRQWRGAAPDDALVFPRSKRTADLTGKNKPCDTQDLTKRLTKILEELGMKQPGLGFHAFRRLHLTWISRRGLSAFEVRDQAGHGDIKTTMEYILPEMGRARKAIAEIEEMVLFGESGKTVN